MIYLIGMSFAVTTLCYFSLLLCEWLDKRVDKKYVNT